MLLFLPEQVGDGKHKYKKGETSMVRMRTAESLLREIQTQDPDTEITLHYLRKLIASGAIPVVHAGRKNLVNMDLVLDYLANGQNHDI